MVGTATTVALIALAIVVAWYLVWPAEQLAWARRAVRHHDYATARSRLNRYLLHWPGDGNALLLAARSAWQSGDYADAERFIIAFKQPPGLTGPGRLEWALLGACQGDFAENELWLRSLAEREDAETSAILEALALGYQRAFRWQDAQIALNQLIEREPTYAALYVQRGAIRRRVGGPYEAEKAEMEFRHALELAPDNADAHAKLAGALLDQGFVREAIKEYRIVLNVTPTNPAALLGEARALSDDARLPDAERRLELLLAAHPDHADALVERGRIALRRGNFGAAEAYLARAVQAAPWHRAGNRLYLASLKEQGLSEAAARCETRLRELRAEDAAGARLQRNAQNSSGDIGGQWQLYQWLVRNGESEQAFACLLGIVSHDSRHGPAQAALAEHFEKTRQPLRAADHRALAGNRSLPE
jgi:Tfp pilus assembly protein PilF